MTGLANSITELSELEIGWSAVVSTSTINARDNTGTRPSVAGGSVGVPIYLVNGARLVNSYDDLWDGSIDVAFDVTESGDTVTSGTLLVGTGTQIDGTVFPGRPMGASFPEIGILSSTAGNWIRFDASLPETQRRIYAISDVIELPIPAPNALSLTIFGLVGIALTRRRKPS